LVKIKGNYANKLTEEDIEFAKEKLRQEYAFFHNTQKLLPNQWEYANEWNVDCLNYRNIQQNHSLNPIDFY